MSDNPQYGSDTFVALPGIRILRLAGRDAVAFAQAQFMNDVAALQDGSWQWSGWLDPKGRVQALFALLRLDAETLWLVTTSESDALSAALRRFVFRSKVVIDDMGLYASGRIAAPATAVGNRAHVEADAAVELDLSGAAGARTLRLSPEPGADTPDTAAWWRLDIAHGWPALPGVVLDAWTPQQLSLHRFDAFSVKKGCYPGQEIVARTHFLGRAKRGLARYRATGASTRDAIRGEDGRDVGQVICTIGDELLAVVPLETADTALSCAGVPLVPLPLAGGMER